MRDKKTRGSDEPMKYASKSQKKKKKKNRHTFGKILAVIQIILSIVFLAVLLMLNVLPMKFLVLIFGVLLLCQRIILIRELSIDMRGMWLK